MVPVYHDTAFIETKKLVTIVTGFFVNLATALCPKGAIEAMY